MTTSAEEHPDLFWAIRGGGGNFGAVTEFVFQGRPAETIVGGPTFWALEDADELLAAYREWLPSAPRNVCAFFAFHTVPARAPIPRGDPSAQTQVKAAYDPDNVFRINQNIPPAS